MFANLQKWRQISDSFRQTTWNIIKLKESIKTPKSTEIEIITFRINYKQRTTMQLYWPENLVWLLTRNLALDFLHFEAPKSTLFWLNQSIEEAKSKNEHTNRRTLSSCRFLTSKCEHAGRILVEDLIRESLVLEFKCDLTWLVRDNAIQIRDRGIVFTTFCAKHYHL